MGHLLTALCCNLLLTIRLPRPPFNYSDGSPMRKSGFLSEGQLLDGRDATVFTQCKSVKQCFKDKFTFHGREHTRRVFVPGAALGIDAATGAQSSDLMSDWRPGDAAKCGIFGIWLADSNKQGINARCPGRWRPC